MGEVPGPSSLEHVERLDEGAGARRRAGEPRPRLHHQMSAAERPRPALEMEDGLRECGLRRVGVLLIHGGPTQRDERNRAERIAVDVIRSLDRVERGERGQSRRGRVAESAKASASRPPAPAVGWSALGSSATARSRHHRASSPC